MASPNMRKMLAGCGWLMVSVCTTAIGLKYGSGSWGLQHSLPLNWIIVVAIAAAAAIAIVYFATNDSQHESVRLENEGNLVGHDNSGKMIANIEHYYEAPPISSPFLDKIPPASSPASAPSRLHIQLAEYVSVDDPARMVTVTECLRQMVVADQLVLEIQNHNFVIGDKNYVPKDPHPYHKKKLRVLYSFNNGPLHEVVLLEESVLNLPQAHPREPSKGNGAIEIASHLQVDFQLTNINYELAHSAWDSASQGGDYHMMREGMIAWFKNPVPEKGASGIDATQLSAHIKYSVDGTWSEEIARAYWLHHSANEITIPVGHREGLVLGVIEWDRWVAYSNPHSTPAHEDFLQPALRYPGPKVQMPKTDMDIDVSLLARGTKTLEQLKIRLVFTNGKPYMVRQR